MEITKIADSRFNHGTNPEVIMTCTINHEVAFSPEDIIQVLRACASDSMAKVINQIGKEFNKDQFAEAYSADEIDEHGREFIESMYYFIRGDAGSKP